MTLLQSITLSNTRRFADNVHIDFGPGATIILAPNGTGKTTVFEAIELALTGTISRLNRINTNLDPFVRDEKAQSIVNLNFGEGMSRSATLTRGEAPILSGNLEGLLGSVEERDLSYLLRLTHLLDQHDRNWFVDAKSDEAGNRLAALPVGKDGVKASGVLISTKKAMGEKLKEAEKKLNEARSKQTQWLKLLLDRDNSTVDLGRPLTPLPDLNNRIKPLADQSGGRLPDEVTLAALSDFFAETVSHVEQEFELLQVRAGILSKCDNLLADFLKSKRELSGAQAQLAQTQTTKLQYEEALTNAKAALDEKDLALQFHQASRRQLVEVQQRVEALAKAKTQETLKNETLEQKEKAVKEAKKALFAATKSYQEACQVSEQHEHLRRRVENLGHTEKELASAKEMLAIWLDHLEEITKLEVAAEDLSSEIGIISQKQQKETETLKNHQEDAEKALRVFDGISHASDVVREAVSTIALQLPKDRDDCPLCGQVHGSNELQLRMTKALEAMDPALRPAAERVEQTRLVVEDANKSLESLRKALSETQLKVAPLTERRVELLSEIEEICSNEIFDKCDFSSAPDAIAKKTTELEPFRQALMVDQSAAPVDQPPEVLAELKQELHSAETILESVNVQLSEAKSALSLAQDRRKATEEAMVDSKGIDDLAQRIVSIDTSITQSSNAVEEARSERDRRRVACDEVNVEARGAEDTVSSTTERVHELRTRWSNIPLAEEPADEILATAKQQLSESQKKIENSRTEIPSIRTELARWQAAEAFHRVQREVTNFRGNSSDDAFTAKLVSELTENEAEVNRISKGSSALGSFSTILKKECAEANQRVGAVVPLWNTLLNRVVREPRFAGTKLDVSSRYNKQHAKTMVSLHGKQTEVHAVASEAQMTDLQLTFLLSMAQQYPWSPWRALLLDDPTQHHDLVHASAVFDLLRDYIADYGFQVVIATHDVLQARFFMRKLENDGIESRLWSLKPTDAGVDAFLGR